MDIFLSKISFIIRIIVIIAMNSFSADFIFYETEGFGVSRQDAIDDALRKSARNCLADFSQISQDSIVAILKTIDIDSLIDTFTVLKNSDSVKYSLISISIKAQINASCLIRVLENLHNQEPLSYSPKILINITDKSEDRLNGKEIFTKMVQQELISKNMTLLDNDILGTVLPINEKPNTSAITQMYHKTGAYFVINGTIQTGEPYQKEVYGITQNRVSCCADLQLVNCADAAIITSLSQCEDRGAQSPLLACETCYKELLKSKKYSIIDSIEKVLTDSRYTLFPATLLLGNLPDSVIVEIENIVSKTPSVIKVTSKIQGEHECRLNLICRGSIHELYVVLLNINDISLTISGKRQIKITTSVSTMKTEASPDANSFTDSISIKGCLSISEYSIPTLFPCAAEHYAAMSTGSLTLCNSSKLPLKKIKLSSAIDGMSCTHDTIIELIPAEKTAVIPIKTRLDQRQIQKIDHSIQAKMSVKCTYKDREITKTAGFSVPVMISGLNDFDWKKPEMIASFVTPSDEIIKKLSRFALTLLHYSADSLPQNLAQAAAIYECLRMTGIAYIKDISIRKNIDNIQFPFQTIIMGTGDCDDTSVLLASLLESVGLETAMLVSENHILVMFNTGVHRKNSHQISPDTSMFITHQDMVWLPVETTYFNQNTFSAAWKKGLEQYHDSKVYDFISVIEVRSSWAMYPPANPFHGEIAMPKISDDDLRGAISASLKELITNHNFELGKTEAKLISMVNTNPDKITFNRLGVFYAQQNDFQKSYANFMEAFKLDSLDPDLQVNLANASCLTERFDDAQRLYSKAISAQPQEGSYYLNQFLFYLKSGESDNSEKAFIHFIQREKIEKLNYYLGLELEPIVNGTAKSDMTSDSKYKISIQIVKNSIKKFSKSILHPLKKNSSATIFPVGDNIDLVDLSRLFWFKQI